MSRPGQRFVPVRSIDNQAELMRHRARELLAGQRTAALNALRGHLAEFGIVSAIGREGLSRLLTIVADRDDGRVTAEARASLEMLAVQLE